MIKSFRRILSVLAKDIFTLVQSSAPSGSYLRRELIPIRVEVVSKRSRVQSRR